MTSFRRALVLGLGLASSAAAGCKKEAPPVQPAPSAAAPAAAQPAPSGKIEVAVTEKGFEPNRLPAKAGKPLNLVITRKTEGTCASEIVFEGEDKKTELPFGKPVEVTYTPKKSGEVKFGCAMGMMVGGVVVVSD